jgi:acetoin utilization protein AcuC
LCKKLQLFDGDRMSIHTPQPASTADILKFHTEPYISILKKANNGVFEEKWLRSGLGTMECPVYEGVYDYHALAAGSSLLGTALIEEGKADIVFSPTGGFHHAGEDFAAGFCYINDIVLAVKKWLYRRKRVLYIDIDAHHGDQVQAAFYNISRVMCISFHENPKTLFPVAQSFQPDVVVAVLGADVLFSDPFSHLRLTNASVCKALEGILQISKKLLALGSGGYVLDNIARTWALAWAVMNGLGPREDDDALFGGMFWGDNISSLNDRPHFVPDDVRRKVRRDLEAVVRGVEKSVFPILKIKT